MANIDTNTSEESPAEVKFNNDFIINAYKKEKDEPRVVRINTIDPLSSDSYNSSFIDEMSPSYDAIDEFKNSGHGNAINSANNFNDKYAPNKKLSQAEMINQMFSQRIRFKKKGQIAVTQKQQLINLKESPLTRTNKNKKKIKLQANISPINIGYISERDLKIRGNQKLRIKTNMGLPPKNSIQNLCHGPYSTSGDDTLSGKSHDYSSRKIVMRKMKLESTPQPQYSLRTSDKGDLTRSVNSINRLKHLKNSIFSKRSSMADYNFSTVSKRKDKFSKYLVFNPWHEAHNENNSIKPNQFSLPKIRKNSIQIDTNESLPYKSLVMDNEEYDTQTIPKRSAAKSHSLKHFEVVKEK